MDDPLQHLLALARSARDFEDFRDQARELASEPGLRDLLGLEFLGLESFFDWARQEAAGEGLEVHPLAQLLREQCRALARELANLAFQHDELVHAVIPSLEVLFLDKVGAGRLRLLEAQVENLRLTRRIEALQACRNRGETPDLEAIDRALEVELEAWTERVRLQRHELEQARRAMGLPVQPETEHEIRSLYRELVKLLHPDLNTVTPERSRLWLQVQEAYERVDVEGLRILVELARNLGGAAPWEPMTSLDALKSQRGRLESQVRALAARIQELKARFPCDHEKLLADPAWVEEQNRHARELLERELERRSVLLQRMKALLEEEGHG